VKCQRTYTDRIDPTTSVVRWLFELKQRVHIVVRGLFRQWARVQPSDINHIYQFEVCQMIYIAETEPHVRAEQGIGIEFRERQVPYELAESG
jgi:hypothetical protein